MAGLILFHSVGMVSSASPAAALAESPGGPLVTTVSTAASTAVAAIGQSSASALVATAGISAGTSLGRGLVGTSSLTNYGTSSSDENKRAFKSDDPEAKNIPIDTSTDFWHLRGVQCPDEIIAELNKLNKDDAIHNACQEFLLCYSKALDSEMTTNEIEKSFESFMVAFEKLIEEKCPKYRGRINFGQALSKATVVLFVLHYAPDSCVNYKGGGRFNKIDIANQCVNWILYGLPVSLHQEAGGDELTQEILDGVREHVRLVDMRPIVPYNKKACKSEFTTCANKLEISSNLFTLIGHIVVGYHVKYFRSLDGNKDKRLPFVAGSYEVNARMYGESGRVTTPLTSKEGFIAHPECWLAGEYL